jgi:hypothetical protein
MNRFNSTNGRTAYSARRFVKVSFDIFGTRDSRRNKPGDGLPSKRPFYCKPILDFIETRVCSLVYKFAFFIDCVSHLHFAPFEGKMAMSVRACLDLLPGLDSCGPDVSSSHAAARMAGHTEYSQVLARNVCGDDRRSAPRAGASSFFSTNSGRSVSSGTTEVQIKQFSFEVALDE